MDGDPGFDKLSPNGGSNHPARPEPPSVRPEPPLPFALSLSKGVPHNQDFDKLSPNGNGQVRTVMVSSVRTVMVSSARTVDSALDVPQ